jgi:hypothetical protein
LQPYAQEDDEEDEELEEALAAKANDLMKRDPRMSPERATMMAAARLNDAMSISKRGGHCGPMGRERELRRRMQDEVIREAQKQFSKVSVRKAGGNDYRVRTAPSYNEAVEIAKRYYPGLFD